MLEEPKPDPKEEGQDQQLGLAYQPATARPDRISEVYSFKWVEHVRIDHGNYIKVTGALWRSLYRWTLRSQVVSRSDDPILRLCVMPHKAESAKIVGHLVGKHYDACLAAELRLWNKGSSN